VVNVAQDEWKRRRKERSRLASAPVFDGEDETNWIESFAGDEFTEHARSPEQHFADAEIAHAVDAAMASLPEMERAVLVLYHQEDCSYEGIASALGLPINTVRTHLHRGRKRLGELVKTRFATVQPATVSIRSPLSTATVGKA
jgi:RNA polymerase sigma-70 factor (ECF subfamily)